MTRVQVSSKLMILVEKVGQSISDISITHLTHPEQREVTCIFVPFDRYGEVKAALEEIFGGPPLDEGRLFQ